MAFTRNKSTEHGGEDLCEVFCDRLRLLAGAVLIDEQQGGYRVRKPNLGTEASFRVIQGCPLSPWLFTISTDRIGSEARKKVYGSVQLPTGGIEVCLWMASYTVLMAELEEALHVIRKS